MQPLCMWVEKGFGIIVKIKPAFKNTDFKEETEALPDHSSTFLWGRRMTWEGSPQFNSKYHLSPTSLPAKNQSRFLRQDNPTSLTHSQTTARFAWNTDLDPLLQLLSFAQRTWWQLSPASQQAFPSLPTCCPLSQEAPWLGCLLSCNHLLNGPEAQPVSVQ